MAERRRVFPDQFEGQFDGGDEEAFELTLNINVAVGMKRLATTVVIPPDYPYDAL